MDYAALKKAFSGNLIEELGIAPVSDKKKEAIINGAVELIGMRFATRVASGLPEQDQEIFTSMMEKNTPEELSSWLLSRGVSFEEVFVEEIARVKEELVKHAAALI